MHVPRRQPLSLSSAGLAALLVAAPLGIGCGAAATPGAATPHEETVVPVAPVVTPIQPVGIVDPHMGADGRVHPQVDPEGVADLTAVGVIDLDDEEPSGSRSLGSSGTMGGPKGAVVGGVVGGISGGIIGGVPGGVLGGSVGGLGLSATGSGGGGTGMGIGLGSVGFGRIGTLRDDPIPGTSVDVASTSTIEYGDSVTLGVSLEAATRALRNNLYKLRECYDKALETSPQAAGAVSFRLVLKADAYISYANIYATTLSRPEAEKCMKEALVKTYVAYPPRDQVGVIETTITFRPTKH